MKINFKKLITYGLWWVATAIVISIALIPVVIVYSMTSLITVMMGSVFGSILTVSLFVLYILAVLAVAGYVIMKFGWKIKK